MNIQAASTIEPKTDEVMRLGHRRQATPTALQTVSDLAERIAGRRRDDSCSARARSGQDGGYARLCQLGRNGIAQYIATSTASLCPNKMSPSQRLPKMPSFVPPSLPESRSTGPSLRRPTHDFDWKLLWIRSNQLAESSQIVRIGHDERNVYVS